MLNIKPHVNDYMFVQVPINDVITTVSNLITGLRASGYTEEQIATAIEEVIVHCGWLKSDFDREVERISISDLAHKSEIEAENKNKNMFN
jgi:hypothetical protein